nr:retrovirus-related Pol polyprotein from transposon TNT 1-94 [Tanacetum cinerariifolium]
MQTQTCNTLHNAIMEAGSKDRPPMLAPGNYVQWKSRIKRYIDTKPNHELIHHCLKNPPYKFTWADKEVPISEGSHVTRTESHMETYKTSQELKTVSYHKLYDILKQHQNEVNEIRAERIARVANPLALVAQQQQVYQPQNHPTQYTQNSSTRSQQAATRNRGKAIVYSPQPIYDQEPSVVAEDDEMSKDKEIDKLMALISLSFKKFYKPTNNILRTSSNTSRENQDNSPRINSSTGYENQRIGNVAGARETVARECQKPKWVKDAAYHREKMLLCKQEEAGIQLNAEQADWRDDTDDELEDQELELIKQDEHNVIIDSLDMSYDREQIDQNDDDADLVHEREIEDFKNKNKSLESSNNHFKEANNKLSETNNLLYVDFKKSQGELARHNDVEYASKVEIDCAKARGDLISYKMESQKSFNKYTQTINDLNHIISKMKEKLCAHQETISILSQQKEAQIKLYKTREDQELDKVVALENKVKVLDNIVYKTGQSVQMINMLNNKCRTSFAKHEFLKKAQRENPRLYDIGCYNDNLALMLAPESDEVIRLEKENSLRSQLETQKTQFLNEIDRLSREYCYADHMNAILGVYTELDEVTNLQCDYLELLEKCECLEKELLKSKMMSKSFEALQKHAINLEIDLQQCQKKIKNDKSFKVNQSKEFCKEREQYFEIQDLKAQLQDKGIVIKKHDMRVLKSVNDVNSRTKMPIVVPVSTREPKCTVKQSVAKPMRKTIDSESNQKPRNTLRNIYECVSKACSWWYPKFTPSGYKWKPKSEKENVNPNVRYKWKPKFGKENVNPNTSMPLGSVSKNANILEHMTSRFSWHGLVFDHSSRHNCPNPICLMAKASSSQAWLWHRRLSHLNFNTINLLSKNDIVVGLPKLKFVKDHLCSSCELGKAKRSKRRLQLLHMDLCGPMRVASINGKRYVLVIVDDYSRYTWTYFLRSKDETPKVLINFLRLGQRGLQAQVRIVRTDKGTEFVNQNLYAYFAAEGIHHQTSVARTP